MTDTTTERLTVLSEVAAIQEARYAIEREKDSVWKQFVAQQERHDSYRMGKLAEALDAAGDALFNVLNLASSHLNCADAKDAIDTWNRRNATAPEDEAVA